jgi:hypothetical protein
MGCCRRAKEPSLTIDDRCILQSHEARDGRHGENIQSSPGSRLASARSYVPGRVPTLRGRAFVTPGCCPASAGANAHVRGAAIPNVLPMAAMRSVLSCAAAEARARRSRVPRPGRDTCLVRDAKADAASGGRHAHHVPRARLWNSGVCYPWENTYPPGPESVVDRQRLVSRAPDFNVRGFSAAQCARHHLRHLIAVANATIPPPACVASETVLGARSSPGTSGLSIRETKWCSM